MSRTVVIVIGVAGVALTGGVAYAFARRRNASPSGRIAGAGSVNASNPTGALANVPPPPPPPPAPPAAWASGSVDGHPVTVGPDGVTVDNYHAGGGELTADIFTGGAVTATKYSLANPQKVVEVFSSFF